MNQLQNKSILALFFNTVIGSVVWQKQFAEVSTSSKNNSKQILEQKRKATNNNPAYVSLIGNTPLVELVSLSAATGCKIYAKMECMNPGGTGKDRASLSMITDAISSGQLQPGGTVVEGTSGSTGISLAYICRSLGYAVHVVLPDDQAKEKSDLLKQLGADVTIVPCCAIANPNHYVNAARKISEQIAVSTGKTCLFTNQFENTANYNAHFTVTGPEIYQQCLSNVREGAESNVGEETKAEKDSVTHMYNPVISAFVMGAGTGGTIGGVSRYLKSVDPNIKIVLADPPGSSLFQKVKYGVCYTSQQCETKVRKHRYDTIVEGVGLDRVTKNFELAKIDTAYSIDDQEVVDMAHYILKREGLWMGSSSALNLVACCKYAFEMRRHEAEAAGESLASGTEAVAGIRKVLVTMICDGGQRHVSRFWNSSHPMYASANGSPGLRWPDADVIPQCVQQFRELD